MRIPLYQRRRILPTLHASQRGLRKAPRPGEPPIFKERDAFPCRCTPVGLSTDSSSPFPLRLSCLLGSLQAFAQSGQVSGTIKDPDQSVVAGAIVTLSNTHTATPLQATTNDAGQYSFSSVAPGTYRLEAHKAGFVTAVVPAVIVSANQMTVTQDAAFALAGDTSSVTVSGGSEGTPATGYYIENVDQGVLGTAARRQSALHDHRDAGRRDRQHPGREICRDAIKYLPLVSYSRAAGPRDPPSLHPWPAGQPLSRTP